MATQVYEAAVVQARLFARQAALIHPKRTVADLAFWPLRRCLLP
jgi:hypothetical protein